MSDDEDPETREAKEKGIDSGGPKTQQTPPPGGWADRDEPDPDPRDPGDEDG